MDRALKIYSILTSILLILGCICALRFFRDFTGVFAFDLELFSDFDHGDTYGATSAAQTQSTSKEIVVSLSPWASTFEQISIDFHQAHPSGTSFSRSIFPESHRLSTGDFIEYTLALFELQATPQEYGSPLCRLPNALADAHRSILRTWSEEPSADPEGAGNIYKQLASTTAMAVGTIWQSTCQVSPSQKQGAQCAWEKGHRHQPTTAIDDAGATHANAEPDLRIEEHRASAEPDHRREAHHATAEPDHRIEIHHATRPDLARDALHASTLPELRMVHFGAHTEARS